MWLWSRGAGLSVSSSELLCIFLRKESQLLGEYRTSVEQPLAIAGTAKLRIAHAQATQLAILPGVPGKNWRQMWSVTEDQVTLYSSVVSRARLCESPACETSHSPNGCCRARCRMTNNIICYKRGRGGTWATYCISLLLCFI